MIEEKMAKEPAMPLYIKEAYELDLKFEKQARRPVFQTRLLSLRAQKPHIASPNSPVRITTIAALGAAKQSLFAGLTAGALRYEW